MFLPLPRRLCDHCVVRLPFYEQDYWKSNEPISLKLGVMIGPTNWKNWFNFWCWYNPTYGLLFHFPHHCGIGDFRFISISHTVTSWFLRYLAKWLTPTRASIHNILEAVVRRQQRRCAKAELKRWVVQRSATIIRWGSLNRQKDLNIPLPTDMLDIKSNRFCKKFKCNKSMLRYQKISVLAKRFWLWSHCHSVTHFS